LRESENAPGNLASDLVEQSSLAPPNRVGEAAARLASAATCGIVCPDEDGRSAAQAAAIAAAIASAAATRVLIG
jgi:hypothetical protein